MIRIEDVVIVILLVIVIILIAIGRRYYRRRLKPLTRLWQKTKDKIPRPWKPKSLANCPVLATLFIHPVFKGGF